MKTGDDTLNFALPSARDSLGALENVGFMRYAADKFSMVFRASDAQVNHFVEQVGKRTAAGLISLLTHSLLRSVFRVRYFLSILDRESVRSRNISRG